MNLTITDYGGPAGAPLLVLGPSLGTSTATLWAPAARLLTDRLRVLGWDLPGHGNSAAAADFDIAAVSAEVLAAVDESHPGAVFHYAGDSVGGAVGLQLALDAAPRIASATLICTGASIGDSDSWHTRARVVRESGTGALLDSAPERWFASGFIDRAPAVAADLLDALAKTDAESYAAVCEALATFDVTDRLTEIDTPVLAIAGAEDLPTPPSALRVISEGVSNGRLVVLDGVGHLAPAESPDLVAGLITTHVAPNTHDAGMAVRREVLGNAHVDRAVAGTTEFTAEFQRFITEYAWGGIWTRPGLDRRSRSLITLTALIARGHHEELAMHLRAARRNGLTNDELKELLLQTAIYCGVPDANTAFRIAKDVLAEYGAGDRA